MAASKTAEIPAPAPLPPSAGVAAAAPEPTGTGDGSGMPSPVPATGSGADADAGAGYVYRVAISMPNLSDVPGKLTVVYPERRYTPAEILLVRTIYRGMGQEGVGGVQIIEEFPAGPDETVSGRELYTELANRYATAAGRKALDRVFPQREIGNFDTPRRVTQ